MSPDIYVLEVVSKYNVPTAPALKASQDFAEVVKGWTRRYLLAQVVTGSYAKGTRVKGGTDIDLVLSVGPRTPGPMKKVYENLFGYMRAKGYKVQRRCVSVLVMTGGFKFDLIPARVQWGTSNNHEIYVTASDKSQMVNFEDQTKYIRDSEWIKEIKAVKIWRNLRGLEFPSYYLELVVLQCLVNAQPQRHAHNLIAALKHIGHHIEDKPIVDPTNTHNAVSDCLTADKKRAVAIAARQSVEQNDLRKIIW
ncbi:MAG: hypothetical protein JSU73_10315 [candidate division WOR-3 bacterium]|nr:MAG: hypothetical protein JSU73_10315 [candidate division WOR-3 bacterium]